MSSFLPFYEYLVLLRQIILRTLHEFEEYGIADFTRLGFILDLDEQRIFETFPRDTLIHIAQAWRILQGVSKAKSISFELGFAQYPHTTVKMALILGGLDRFTALISKASHKERIQDLDAFGAELWQGETWRSYVSLKEPPLSSIHHLAAPGKKRVSSMDFPKNMRQRAISTFIGCQDICESSLKAVILRVAGTLDNIQLVERYICQAVSEERVSYGLLSLWNVVDNAR